MHSVATGKCLRHQTKGCVTCGNFPLRLPPPGTNHLPPYLQRLQVSILRVAQQGGDAVVVPHAADVGVAPHGEDLSDDGHATPGRCAPAPLSLHRSPPEETARQGKKSTLIQVETHQHMCHSGRAARFVHSSSHRLCYGGFLAWITGVDSALSFISYKKHVLCLSIRQHEL